MAAAKEVARNIVLACKLASWVVETLETQQLGSFILFKCQYQSLLRSRLASQMVQRLYDILRTPKRNGQ